MSVFNLLVALATHITKQQKRGKPFQGGHSTMALARYINRLGPKGLEEAGIPHKYHKYLTQMEAVGHGVMFHLCIQY